MASTFKDQVVKDIELVFLNLDEFGETHEVEGREITIVIDDDALITRKGAELGVAESSLLIFARCEDLPERKAPGSAINIDGREYIVDDWTESTGVAQIALSQHRGI
jgi:hypothetical protein